MFWSHWNQLFGLFCEPYEEVQCSGNFSQSRLGYCTTTETPLFIINENKGKLRYFFPHYFDISNDFMKTVRARVIRQVNEFSKLWIKLQDYYADAECVKAILFHRFLCIPLFSGVFRTYRKMQVPWNVLEIAMEKQN